VFAEEHLSVFAFFGPNPRKFLPRKVHNLPTAKVFRKIYEKNKFSFLLQ